MKNITKKLEKFIDNYTDNLQKKPVSTIIKTMIVIWLVSKVVKMLRK